MARKTTRRHAQGDASRQLILEAALALGGERGYVGTTLALIKKRTGLPTSALYWHFDSKDGLLADALSHGFARWHERAARWQATPDTELLAREGLAAALLDSLRASITGLEDEPGFWRMGLMLALESGPAVGESPRDRFLKIRSEALGTLESWWTAAAPDSLHDCRSLARLTLAALDGLFIRQQSEGSTDTDEMLDLLARGLAYLAVTAPETDALPPLPPRAAAGRDTTDRTEEHSGRDKLFAAAHEVAAESGYEGATISRICAAAGLPPSSLYWHFDSKDDLFAAVVDASYEEWAAEQPAWTPPTAGEAWAIDLRKHLVATAASLTELPAFLRIGYMLLLMKRGEPTPGRDHFIEVRSQVRRYTTEWFVGAGAEQRDAAHRAGLLMVLCDGLFITQMIDTPAWDPYVAADLLTGALSAGL